MSEPVVEPTAIPGLLVVHLPLHRDSRGWFKENWQRERMVAAGLPDFEPVQQNVSYNSGTGVTRGLHAEPWDKLVSVTHGEAFGAWVDLRAGETFGAVVTTQLGPETAVFVPRGVANGYQTVAPDTSYAYLVNDHWSPQARDSYTYVNAADPELAIPWPLPLENAEMSEADRAHPPLADVVAFPRLRTLVVGGNGQVGRALAALMPGADVVGRDRLDLASQESVGAFEWRPYDVIVNAAAFTAVDAAETAEGRRAAWATNVEGVRRLVEAARRRRAVLVHISSDYVFDGETEVHTEEEPVAPLGVYGQTKAAGDAVVAGCPRHYILRTSWVVGQGRNFVRTVQGLASSGVSPDVVDDQRGRLSFADDIARAAQHLVETGAPYGTYNVSSAGEPWTWADAAAAVFELSGRSADDVGRISTEQFAEGRSMAPRPRHSTLDLTKIEATGFVPSDQREALRRYLAAGD